MDKSGLVTIVSSFSPEATVQRLVDAIAARGLSVFARVDHAKNAADAGLELRPTELVIFGNAKGGTPIMSANQRSGIDLPMKALVWQDAEGHVWLAYNDPRWLADRHGIGPSAGRAMDAMMAGLASIAAEATGPDAP
jgi:uncharacterized protein (DUF302 family)